MKEQVQLHWDQVAQGPCAKVQKYVKVGRNVAVR